MRLRLLILLMTLALCPAIMRAQSDDMVVGGTGDIQFMDTVPLAGSPLLNRLTGESINSQLFHKNFFNILVSFSDNAGIGIGADYTRIPKQWGWHVSAQVWPAASRTLSVAGGVVVRPVMQTSFLDWQLYAGPVIHRSIGIEYGTRISRVRDNDSYSIWSLTLSRGHVRNNNYVSVGLSADLLLLILLIL